MAKPVSRERLPNGRAGIHLYLPGDLRDRLARAAFDAGEPVSALVERAVVAALDTASMLEAEGLAVTLTEKDAAEQFRGSARRRRGGG